MNDYKKFLKLVANAMRHGINLINLKLSIFFTALDAFSFFNLKTTSFIFMLILYRKRNDNVAWKWNDDFFLSHSQPLDPLEGKFFLKLVFLTVIFL